MQGQEQLMTVLDNLERSYNPSDPAYKFSHVFYNVVNRPFERPAAFPEHLWNQALLPDRTLMPVILNREQIVERKALQDDVAKKLNGAHSALQRRIDRLRTRREEIREKLVEVVRKYRVLTRQYALGEPVEEIYRLHPYVLAREPYVVRAQHGELTGYLTQMKERLSLLGKRVDDLTGQVDRRRIEAYKLDK